MQSFLPQTSMNVRTGICSAAAAMGLNSASTRMVPTSASATRGCTRSTVPVEVSSCPCLMAILLTLLMFTGFLFSLYNSEYETINTAGKTLFFLSTPLINHITSLVPFSISPLCLDTANPFQATVVFLENTASCIEFVFRESLWIVSSATNNESSLEFHFVSWQEDLMWQLAKGCNCILMGVWGLGWNCKIFVLSHRTVKLGCTEFG